jgi:hypothetical protein
MTWIKLFNSSIKLFFLLILTGYSMNSNSLPLRTESTTAGTLKQASSNSNLIGVPLKYNPPVDDAPSGRKPTAGRDDCPSVDKPLTALVPEYYLGLTAAEFPTFWFYIPYGSNAIKSAELVLWDEQQNKIDEVTFSVTNTPGIVSVRLPKKALEIGKRYRIDFSVTCNGGNSNAPGSKPIVKSWIKRVSLDANLVNQLKAATTPRERYVLYAANSLWYEALTELAELRQDKPHDQKVTADWEALLSQQEINLSELISEPIVSCCTSK